MFFAMTLPYAVKLGMLSEVVGDVLKEVAENLQWHSLEVWLGIYKD